MKKPMPLMPGESRPRPRKFKTLTVAEYSAKYDAHNAKLRAEHARLRAEILALRPSWDPAKLEAITFSYGLPAPGADPGLWDILQAVKAADALEARFAPKPEEDLYCVIARLDREPDGAKGRYQLTRSSSGQPFSPLVEAERYAAEVNPSREPIVLRAVHAPFGASS